MSEWEVVSVLIAFVIGFVSGVVYALRLYKRLEANSDREWAKRRGMREKTTHYDERPARITPILRRKQL